jgi:hypothetical protein
MKKKKEKMNITISIDKKLNDYIDELFSNKSKYVEWLVYQDLKNNNVNLEKIII